MKRGAILFVLLIFIILSSGCQTIKGAFSGVMEGAAEGAKKDWSSLKKIDEWMRENLW